MSGWRAFWNLLEAERTALAELSRSAEAMTRVLVSGTPADIEAADKALEGRRMVHAAAYRKRVELQTTGFGERTLAEVVTFAPPTLRRRLAASVREIQMRIELLRITVDNNKALVAHGMQRLRRIAAILYGAGTEQTGTYRRRGVVRPSEGSVLVSRKA